MSFILMNIALKNWINLNGDFLIFPLIPQKKLRFITHEIHKKLMQLTQTRKQDDESAYLIQRRVCITDK